MSQEEHVRTDGQTLHIDLLVSKGEQLGTGVTAATGGGVTVDKLARGSADDSYGGVSHAGDISHNQLLATAARDGRTGLNASSYNGSSGDAGHGPSWRTRFLRALQPLDKGPLGHEHSVPPVDRIEPDAKAAQNDRRDRIVSMRDRTFCGPVVLADTRSEPRGQIGVGTMLSDAAERISTQLDVAARGRGSQVRGPVAVQQQWLNREIDL